MIELRRGNLLEADAEALVNTVNCVGVMGKGIALQFKQAYPDNFRRYERACRAGAVVPGQILVVETGRLVNPRYIINFPTKRHWRGKSRIADIRAGLEALVEEVKRLGLRSIAVPPLGCGNGGLEWGEVRPLIESAFATVPDVRVLLFVPNGAPAAETMLVATRRPGLTRARALVVALLDRYARVGYGLTLLEVQKLAYFLQAAGEPLRLNYQKHVYGPYAHNLNHLLERLEGHYIRGLGDRSGRAALRLLPGAADEALDFLADHPEALEHLDRVRHLIDGFETPHGMELLATVHWVASENPDLAGDEVAVMNKVFEWSERKQAAFKREHIFEAWKQLRDQGWLAGAIRVTA